MGWPGPMTHRQFDAWQWWLREGEPSRVEWHLMQLAAIACGKEINSMAIKFKTTKVSEDEVPGQRYPISDQEREDWARYNSIKHLPPEQRRKILKEVQAKRRGDQSKKGE
jgi:hypothetical protein